MIQQNIIPILINYWTKQKVLCFKSTLSGAFIGTDLAKLCATVGLPRQDWWLFKFVIPTRHQVKSDVVFGSIYNWTLNYRLNDAICYAIDDSGNERYANSSFLSFMQFLVLFDESCKRIQTECPGDSGVEWDRGDIIIQEMEASMRLIDSRAFENNSSLWPYIIIDING